MPISITVGPPMAPSGMTTYRYDANGRRTYKSTEYGATYYYINNVQGRTIAVLKANGSLKMLNLFGLDHIGYIDAYYIPQGAKDEDAPRSDARFYYLKDHLGNIKVTVDQTGSVASYDDYDPFGMGLEGRSGNISGIDTRFKFTSKERDSETGYDWLEARGYDARIGRFYGADPLQDLYPDQSPYSYAFNNPMRYVDPTGRGPEDSLGTKYVPPPGNYVIEEVVVTAVRPAPTYNAGMALVATAGGIDPEPITKTVLLAGSAIYTGYYLWQMHQYYSKQTPKEKPQETENVRNPAQDKRLTPGEIKELKDKGYDPHELKDYQKGKDIFKDPNGNLYIKPKSGAGPGEPLNININNLKPLK